MRKARGGWGVGGEGSVWALSARGARALARMASMELPLTRDVHRRAGAGALTASPGGGGGRRRSRVTRVLCWVAMLALAGAAAFSLPSFVRSPVALAGEEAELKSAAVRVSKPKGAARASDAGALRADSALAQAAEQVAQPELSPPPQAHIPQAKGLYALGTATGIDGSEVRQRLASSSRWPPAPAAPP